MSGLPNAVDTEARRLMKILNLPEDRRDGVKWTDVNIILAPYNFEVIAGELYLIGSSEATAAREQYLKMRGTMVDQSGVGVSDVPEVISENK